MQRNGLMTFLHDTNLVITGSGSCCTLADYDRIWSATIDDNISHDGSVRRTWVPDDSWMLGEFMAALVRIAVNRFMKVDDLSVLHAGLDVCDLLSPARHSQMLISR